MTIFCISCPAELPERHADAVKHFAERKVDAQFINGIHGEAFGILSWRPYRRENPAIGQLMDISVTGISLSHYMTWQICWFYEDETFLILEDDAYFVEDWAIRLNQAILDLPEDWDILLIGSCCCADKPQTQIKGEVFEVKYPFCCHAYLVNRRCIPKLLELGRDAAIPVDVLLMDKIYPLLRVYTVLPRIASQRYGYKGVELPL
jgi:GR25 family glycosyltransferase involved in LPS biosynthesis